MTTKTREAKPKWCSPCKKTRRGITTDEGFRCNQCAEEMGFTIKKRKGQGGAGRFASPMGHLFGVGRSAVDARAAQIATADGTMRRRAAAKKAAATRRRKAAEAARKAMFDGMQPMNSMMAQFIPMSAPSAVCRGCKGRADPRRVEWLTRDFKACVCSECVKEVNA
jgi:hypothetical protein